MLMVEEKIKNEKAGGYPAFQLWRRKIACQGRCPWRRKWVCVPYRPK